MSTFTPWNGPQGGCVGPTREMWDDLISQYKELLNNSNYVTKVEGKGLSTCDYTQSEKDRVNSLGTAAFRGIGGIGSGANDLVTGDTIYDTLQNYVLKSVNKGLSSNDYSDTDKAKVDSINTAAAKEYTDMLENSHKLIESQAVYSAIANCVQHDGNKVLSDNNFTTAYKNKLDSINDYDYVTDMSMHTIHAKLGGSDDVGVYYNIGMIDPEKPCTVYLKYTNSSPFEAIVNIAMSVDSNENATAVLSAITNGEGLKFLVVKNTAPNNTEHYYLAVQKRDWIPEFASTDGVGYFSTVEMTISSINFYPIGYPKYIDYNAVSPGTHIIASCEVSEGFAATAFSLNRVVDTEGHVMIESVDGQLILGEEGFGPNIIDNGTPQPLLSAADVYIGVISEWPIASNVGGVMVAQNYPDVFLPCNGSTFSTTDYPELYAVLGTTTLPVRDYGIIRAKAI